MCRRRLRIASGEGTRENLSNEVAKWFHRRRAVILAMAEKDPPRKRYSIADLFLSALALVVNPREDTREGNLPD